MSYNSGAILLLISNRPRTLCSADLKLLARLFPELYSTQPNYYYLFKDSVAWDLILGIHRN